MAKENVFHLYDELEHPLGEVDVKPFDGESPPPRSTGRFRTVSANADHLKYHVIFLLRKPNLSNFIRIHIIEIEDDGVNVAVDYEVKA